jgi:hypothetical protein
MLLCLKAHLFQLDDANMNIKAESPLKIIRTLTGINHFV